ncbi:MAG TPA: sigma-70 family RNA polymerase sigma factor [Planctomycetota bacterium]|nr:sigma-70 family RNA polymerase sigma factor [Planctomycetota bacterium]
MSNTLMIVRNTPFPVTAWTQIEAAKGEGAAAQQGLNAMCEAYWTPVFGFILRRIRNAEKAEDWTQDFFRSVVKNRTLINKADRSRGKFRAFLSQRLQWFLLDEFKRERTLLKTTPLDENAALEIPEPIKDPEFNAKWAERTLNQALDWLEDQYRREGKERRQQILAKRRAHVRSSEIANSLNLSLDTVKNELRAIRKESEECLKNLVRATVADEADMPEELDEMWRLLAWKPASPRTAQPSAEAAD